MSWRCGQAWLSQQLDYLRGNRDQLTERLREMPGLTLAGPEATYLAWIDTSGLDVDNPHAFFEQAGVGLSAGADFGCPRTVLDTALDRMVHACQQRRGHSAAPVPLRMLGDNDSAQGLRVKFHGDAPVADRQRGIG
ncbi:hypothetical protein SGGMMB4_02840 [Sodalis glossinidius str. 'morsitans']|uniref:Uncharacterized protein n=1 Tax=Sodalis glossinidius (strain morsitans) TaxID=343509 RepID=A0A193QJ88_SODGM|nr:hypothetical protein SGGMMB4_02840 [Sodalis glossinidius str. 'morsitans']